MHKHLFVLHAYVKAFYNRITSSLYPSQKIRRYKGKNRALFHIHLTQLKVLVCKCSSVQHIDLAFCS